MLLIQEFLEINLDLYHSNNNNNSIIIINQIKCKNIINRHNFNKNKHSHKEMMIQQRQPREINRYLKSMIIMNQWKYVQKGVEDHLKFQLQKNIETLVLKFFSKKEKNLIAKQLEKEMNNQNMKDRIGMEEIKRRNIIQRQLLNNNNPKKITNGNNKVNSLELHCDLIKIEMVIMKEALYLIHTKMIWYHVIIVEENSIQMQLKIIFLFVLIKLESIN